MQLKARFPCDAKGMVYKEVGDKLEALSAKGRARVIHPGPPEISKEKGLLHLYVLKERVEVTVTKPLIPSSSALFADSHKEIGDTLEGYRVDMRCVKPLRKKDIEVKPGSADHQAQFFSTRKYTYAELIFAY